MPILGLAQHQCSRTAESKVRPVRSARRVHPAKASDPAGSSGSRWPAASAPVLSVPAPPSAAHPRVWSLNLQHEELPRGRLKRSLALPARPTRNFSKLNQARVGEPLRPEREKQLRARPEGQWDSGWLGARALAACLLSQLLGAGLAPGSLLRCPRLRGVATTACAALGGWEAPAARAALTIVAQPTCQQHSLPSGLLILAFLPSVYSFL